MSSDWRPSSILRPLFNLEDTNFLVSAAVQKARTVKIPMIIMQTWKTKDIPKHWQAGPQAIQKFMPDWKYHLLTDSENDTFVKRYFPDFWSVFSTFEYPIQRADAIRYMWFYVHGGIYLDLDLEIVKPLDDLFYEERDLYVVRSSFMENVYTNAFIGAKPRLRVMLQCLEDMRAPYAAWHVGKHLKVVNSTGPNMFTKAISNIKAQSLLKVQNKEERGERILPGDRFEVAELPSHLIIACSICDPKPCCSEGGYCRTLGGSSWSGDDTNLLTFAYCNRYALGSLLLLVIFIIVVTVFIYYRRKRERLAD
jgi:mannosyltransferase OCH1-like enzyme